MAEGELIKNLIYNLQIANGLFSNKGEVARVRLLNELFQLIQNKAAEADISAMYDETKEPEKMEVYDSK